MIYIFSLQDIINKFLTGLLRRAPFRKEKTKYMKNMENKMVVIAGIEKFKLYAEPRGIWMKFKTYGTDRKVIHNGKTSNREAIDAVAKDGTKGWIINLAGRQRKFMTPADGYLVI